MPADTAAQSASRHSGLFTLVCSFAAPPTADSIPLRIPLCPNPLTTPLLCSNHLPTPPLYLCPHHVPSTRHPALPRCCDVALLLSPHCAAPAAPAATALRRATPAQWQHRVVVWPLVIIPTRHKRHRLSAAAGPIDPTVHTCGAHTAHGTQTARTAHNKHTEHSHTAHRQHIQRTYSTRTQRTYTTNQYWAHTFARTKHTAAHAAHNPTVLYCNTAICIPHVTHTYIRHTAHNEHTLVTIANAYGRNAGHVPRIGWKQQTRTYILRMPGKIRRYKQLVCIYRQLMLAHVY